jgi:hypothetical protein
MWKGNKTILFVVFATLVLTMYRRSIANQISSGTGASIPMSDRTIAALKTATRVSSKEVL